MLRHDASGGRRDLVGGVLVFKKRKLILRRVVAGVPNARKDASAPQLGAGSPCAALGRGRRLHFHAVYEAKRRGELAFLYARYFRAQTSGTVGASVRRHRSMKHLLR